MAFRRLNRSPAPHPLFMGKTVQESHAVGLNKRDEEEMDRWHRMQGKTEPPKKKKKCGVPEGTQNRLKHGIFANKCLNPEEKEMFDMLIEQLCDDFQFNKSSDFIQVELVGVYSVKLVRAQMEGNLPAAEQFDRMIRAHMRDLKTTKISREGVEPKGPTTSPAEWAAALLESVAKVGKKKATPRKKAKKIADNTKSKKK